MDWRIEGVVQVVFSRLPSGSAGNYALQRAAGGRHDESSHIDLRFRADGLAQMRPPNALGKGERGRDLNEPHAELPSRVEGFPIAPEFRRYPKEQLRCTSVAIAERTSRAKASA